MIWKHRAETKSMSSNSSGAFGKSICSICYEDLNPILEDLQAISICGHVFHELWFLPLSPSFISLPHRQSFNLVFFLTFVLFSAFPPIHQPSAMAGVLPCRQEKQLPCMQAVLLSEEHLSTLFPVDGGPIYTDHHFFSETIRCRCRGMLSLSKHLSIFTGSNPDFCFWPLFCFVCLFFRHCTKRSRNWRWSFLGLILPSRISSSVSRNSVRRWCISPFLNSICFVPSGLGSGYDPKSELVWIFWWVLVAMICSVFCPNCWIWT